MMHIRFALLTALAFYGPLRAQDTIPAATPEEVHQLEQRIDSFAIAISTRINTISSSTDIDSIQRIAQEIEEHSSRLIGHVEEVFPIPEELELEIALDEVSPLDLEPDQAVEHQRRALEARKKLNTIMPPYYAHLRQIQELSMRMGNARRLARVHELNEELRAIQLASSAAEE